MEPHHADTIVALATAPGGALAVVRLSGPGAIAVAEQVFQPERILAGAAPFSVHHGWVAGSSGEYLDEVLATVFRAPRSYTGEDLLEFSCHGGALVSRRIVERLIECGARSAEPGEFTRRAFLNGKMDLSQAEAVADLIRCGSDRAHRVSIEQLRGHLGAQVRKIRQDLTECSALLELEIDFSEEGIDLVSRGDLIEKLMGFHRRLCSARDSFQKGRLYRDGVSVAIVGKPNAGKSSIFNALLRSRRAIVTSVPGTTRDTLEEGLQIDGLAFRLTDTAGLREAENPAEAEGVERTRAAIETSDALVVVVDATVDVDPWQEVREAVPKDYSGSVRIVLNKCDLLEGGGPKAPETPVARGRRAIRTSALTGRGIDELQKALAEIGAELPHESGEVFLTNRRHHDAFDRAASAVLSAVGALNEGTSNEFVAFDIREASSALAEITGEVSSEELLNHIFGSFCIGK